MGGVFSNQEKEIRPSTPETDKKTLRKQILQSDRYIKNRPWIFELEEQIINHHPKRYFETEDDYVTYIFDTLSLSSVPFCVFDVPFQSNFKNSRFPIDVIVGLYSVHDEILDVQFFVSDVFVGRYTLIPFRICPLQKFLLRFLFYGHNNDPMIQIKHVHASKDIESKITLICCVLDNTVRKDCVLYSCMPVYRDHDTVDPI